MFSAQTLHRDRRERALQSHFLALASISMTTGLIVSYPEPCRGRIITGTGAFLMIFDAAEPRKTWVD